MSFIQSSEERGALKNYVCNVTRGHPKVQPPGAVDAFDLIGFKASVARIVQVLNKDGYHGVSDDRDS